MSVCTKSTEQADGIDSNLTDLSVYRYKSFFLISSRVMLHSQH